MEKVITDAIEYLEIASEDDAWKRFSSFGVTELMIPKTAKEIKNYVLRQHQLLVTSNTKMRMQGLPKASSIINILDDRIINGYYDYFYNEKQALMEMKKVLNSKIKTFDETIPKCSSCGIILNSLYLFHLENQQRLTLAVDYCGIIHKGFNFSYDESRIVSSGNEFVKKLTIKFNEELKKGTSNDVKPD